MAEQSIQPPPESRPLFHWLLGFAVALTVVFFLTNLPSGATNLPVRLVRLLCIFASFMAAFGVHYHVMDGLRVQDRRRGWWLAPVLLLLGFGFIGVCSQLNLLVEHNYLHPNQALILEAGLFILLLLIPVTIARRRRKGRNVPDVLLLFNVIMPPVALVAIGWLAGVESKILLEGASSAALAALIWAFFAPSMAKTGRPVATGPLLFFYVIMSLNLFTPGATLALAGCALLIGFLSWLLPGTAGDLGAMLVTPIVSLAFFPLLFFPRFRRLRHEWFPSYLPPLRTRRGQGVTLIELLIEIAIIAITSVTVIHATGSTHRFAQRQGDWRAAIALTEDEFALLRARPALPGLGLYPVEPELAAHPFAKQAEVEVKAGPAEALREVWVRVKIRGDGSDRDVALSAILPATTTPVGGAK